MGIPQRQLPPVRHCGISSGAKGRCLDLASQLPAVVLFWQQHLAALLGHCEREVLHF